jgi:hypothetical protein
VAFFYVDSNIGIRTTGGGTTEQIGTMAALGAANIYATISLAIADGAGDGDIIRCGHLHAHSTSSAITYSGPTGAGQKLVIESVDDGAIDQLRKGATESQTGTTSDIVFNTSGTYVLIGMILKAADFFRQNSDSKVHARLCDFYFLNASNVWDINGDGTSLEFDQVDVHFKNNCYFEPVQGGVFRWRGGTLVDTDAAGLDKFIRDAAATSGGFTFEGYGVNLSAVDGGASGYLFQNHGAGTADDALRIRMDLCKVNAGLNGFFEEDMVQYGNDILITRCTSSTTEAEYQWERHDRGGNAKHVTNIYRTATLGEYEETAQKVSLKIIPTADCDIHTPFIVEIPTTYANISNASTNTFTFHLLCANTLKDTEFWIVGMYPDGTNRNQANFAISAGATSVMTGTYSIDTTAAGSALTVGDSDWTGDAGTENYYQVTANLDSTGVGGVGADCMPRFFAYVATGSIASGIYLDIVPVVD